MARSEPPTGRLPAPQLLKFLQANKAKYFVAEYVDAEEDYLRWWANE